jgi:hypothetical protein
VCDGACCATRATGDDNITKAGIVLLFILKGYGMLDRAFFCKSKKKPLK